MGFSVSTRSPFTSMPASAKRPSMSGSSFAMP